MDDKVVCGDQWLALVERRHGEKDVLVVKAKDESLIVPLTPDNEVIFTVEPSPAQGGSVLILPGGEVEDDELTLDTANRELQEEIGFRAKRLDFLAALHPWAKYLTVTSHVYLARDLVPGALKGDEDYEITTRRVPLASFERLISTGELTDAHVIAALYIAARYIQWEGGAG
ncbi:MAG: NUDIX domain-containing protein [Anaerolineae bacterium]|nr:NUDIX domain-containing protein [Anaerolineae bacterium]